MDYVVPGILIVVGAAVLVFIQRFLNITSSTRDLPEKAVIEQKTLEHEKALEKTFLEDKKDLEDEHSGEVARTVADLKAAEPTYVDDPEHLNEFLLQVGKDVRGRSE